jgi:ABC-2 type transport system ATP-binding protein
VTVSELKRQIPGSHVRFRFADGLELDTALRLLTGATRDDEDDLILRVPSDGGAKSVRAGAAGQQGPRRSVR